VYRCPLCNKGFKSFAGLKLHFVKSHPMDGRGDCPLCGRRGVELRMHYYNRARAGDLKHKVVYGLTPRSNGWRESSLKKECRRLAMEMLKGPRPSLLSLAREEEGQIDQDAGG
jgi:hypothetical protein